MKSRKENYKSYNFSFFLFILFIFSFFCFSWFFYIKISDPWILRTVYFSQLIPLEKVLFPVFLSEEAMMYVHRPVIFLIYGLFFVSNWELMYKIYQFFSFFLFGVSVFVFFYLLSQNKYLSLLTSILSLLMPPIFISFFVSDTDVLGAALIFLTGIFYLKYIKTRKKHFILFFYFFGILAIFYKEPTRIFLVLFLVLFSYYFIKTKRLKINTVIKLLFPIFLISLLSSLYVIFTPKPGWFNLSFSFVERLWPIFSFIWFQLLFATGVFLLQIFIFKEKKKIRNIIGIFLTIFLFFFWNYQCFSHFLGMIMPTILFPFGIIGVFTLFSLFWNLKEEKDNMFKFSILIFLLWFLAIFTVITFNIIYREDISSRVFIYSLPFIIFPALKRFFDIKEKLTKKLSLGILILTLFTSLTFIFYFSFSSFSFYTLYHEELKFFFTHLSNFSSKNEEILVLYVNPLLPIGNPENKILFNSINIPKIKYWYLDANTFSSQKFISLKASICDRLQTTKKKYTKLYIIEIKEVLHETNIRENIKFEWTENPNLPSLFKPGHPAGIWPYSTNLPHYYFSLHDPEYDIDLYFLAYNISPIFLKRKEFLTFFPKFPFLKNVKIEGKIYLIENPYEFFNCKGIFTFEQYKNETFFWIWKKAEILVFSEEENKYLRFITWPFYRERKMKLILNNNSFEFYIPKEGMRITIPTPLKRGLNRIIIISKDSCDKPKEVGSWDFDIRCLSFGIKDLHIIDISNGWLPEEKYENISFRWMGKEGKIKIHIPKKGNYTILMDMFSFRIQREIEIYINNNTFKFLIPPSGKRIEIPIYFENQGNYTLFIRSDCEIPFISGKWNAWECISIAALIKNSTNVEPPLAKIKQNIEQSIKETFLKEKNIIIFGKDGKITIYAKEKYENLIGKMIFVAIEDYRSLEIYLNSTLLSKIFLPPNKSTEIFLHFNLSPGINEIKIVSDSCSLVREKCVSVGAFLLNKKVEKEIEGLKIFPEIIMIYEKRN